MFIGKKLKSRIFLLAWIPVLQLLLLIDMARKSIWWIWAYILPVCIFWFPFFVPVVKPVWWFFVGMFIFCANIFTVSALLWSHIIRILKKPPWLALLMVIPILNIFTHIYLLMDKKPVKKTIEPLPGRF